MAFYSFCLPPWEKGVSLCLLCMADASSPDIYSGADAAIIKSLSFSKVCDKYNSSAKDICSWPSNRGSLKQ